MDWALYAWLHGALANADDEGEQQKQEKKHQKPTEEFAPVETAERNEGGQFLV